MVAVKTPHGITKRVNIPSIVQQGGTWGPMLCSNSIDTLGKKCKNRGKHHYLYKKTVRVIPLAMVDDYLGIAKCGGDSVDLNIFINTQIEMKKLEFHTPKENGKSKCHKMHIGRQHEDCKTLKVHNTEMQMVSHDTYLGDIISKKKYKKQSVKSNRYHNPNYKLSRTGQFWGPLL